MKVVGASGDRLRLLESKLMSVDAKGPVFAAGTEVITQDGYEVLFLPDVNNDFLQREGKPPVYHWLPNTVRLAQKPNGDFKFSFVHFVGVRSGSTSVGVQGTDEVAGGLVGFSTTAAIPPQTLAAAEQKLLDRFRGSDQTFWGWRVPAAPMFRPAPIVSNVTTITNLGPNANGSVPGVPAPATPPGGGGAAGPGGAPPPSPAGAPPGGPRRIGPPIVRDLSSLVVPTFPRTVPLARGFRGSNLDPWFVNLGGQGPGAISPMAENAYSGLVGSLPAALIWASFHGGTTPIGVWQNMRMKVWAPLVEIWIDGNWSRIQDHFSAAAHGGWWFWSADIKAEFNNLRLNGDIQVQISVDPTIPGGEKIQEMIDKRTDLVFQKFMEEAQKVIFDPASFSEKPAEASGGFLGLGGGAAFKLRQDRTTLSLHYHEKREMAYLQEYPISGQLEGLYDQLKADPSSEKKYFINLYIDDWDRKITRHFKPVVNWPDASRKWAGEPVSFLSVQTGYPDVNGAVQWDGHVFQASDGPNADWYTAMAKKNKADVANPPSGWNPDLTFIKRKIHFNEPPSEMENPFVRIAVERNEVDLDPGPNGTLANDINLEVRVDNVGALNVGPIFLGVDLETPKQIVEVTFKALGKSIDGNERAPVKFSWGLNDQAEARYWMIFTGQPDFVPKYQYQVRVLVKGSIMTHGMEWIGPWIEASGNGPLMVRVATPEDPGVTVISRTITSAATAGAPYAGAPKPSGNGKLPAGQPPAVGIPTPAGHPPAGRGVAAGAPPPRPAGAADDPFAVDGFKVRDAVNVNARGIMDGETSAKSRGVMPAGPAGQPPAMHTKGVHTRAPVTLGGHLLQDDGPAG
jgi:hypothetical protein